jgi:anti-sigma factor (TIGR02949 family)
MNCSQAGARLAALHDGELDAAATTALRAHVATCPHCRAELAGLEQLGRDIRAQVPRHAAPAALRARVHAAVSAAAGGYPATSPAATTAPPLRRDRRRWFAAGALAGALLAVALGAATLALVQRQVNDEVALEAVDNHVRATLADHLVAVVSSDRHTVKPWLSARLDYAAPVLELPESGFALAGARIDSLDRRPVATLVYRYGNHVVDVFVRPLAPGATGPRLDTVRGFNVARAVGAGMEWRAVADVDAAMLVPFVERLAAAAAPAPAR